MTLQALNELGGNPLDASLEIRAKNPSDYESIVSFLEASPALSVGGVSIVDRVNYAQNKEVIDRLTLAIKATREIGFAVVVLFAFASILIAFATVRLAIYTSKDEIAVMRLVGASNAYIQGPFIVTGIITGVISALLVLLLLCNGDVVCGGRKLLTGSADSTLRPITRATLPPSFSYLLIGNCTRCNCFGVRYT